MESINKCTEAWKREIIFANKNADFWKLARQARVSGIAASDRRRSSRGKQNVEDTRRETKRPPPGGPGVVHLKGPFISTCVYCPSCVWPRISLLRFVSPLQRSQCIFPRAQAGSHLTFWRSAPQRSTRNKRLCSQTHARERALSDNVETQYLSHFDRTDTRTLHVHECTDGSTKEIRASTAKAYCLFSPGASRKAPRGERECLSIYWWNLRTTSQENLPRFISRETIRLGRDIQLWKYSHLRKTPEHFQPNIIIKETFIFKTWKPFFP